MRKLLAFAIVAVALLWLFNKRAATPAPEAPIVQAEPAQSPVPPQPQPQTAAAPTETRDDAAIRMRIDDMAGGTYFREMLAQQDSLVTRWPDRRIDALRIWIEPSSNAPNWNPQYPLVAERAFEQWREAGFPVRFDRQVDSAGAAIQIRWTTRLVAGGREIGLTQKTRDRDGWIVHAVIQIATFDGRGNALSAETVAGVARHEIGHALGLGHSPSPSDVMYPESTTPLISAPDRATLHLLYTLPPGVVK